MCEREREREREGVDPGQFPVVTLQRISVITGRVVWY